MEGNHRDVLEIYTGGKTRSQKSVMEVGRSNSSSSSSSSGSSSTSSIFGVKFRVINVNHNCAKRFFLNHRLILL
jgi:hypothetical protein